MQPRLPNEAPDRVVLPPTDPFLYVRDGSSKEPQYTTSVSPVSAKVFTSSFDAEKVGLSSYISHPKQNLGSGFRRVRLVAIDLMLAVDNINPKNGELTIIYPEHLGDPPTFEVFRLVPGNYSTIEEIVTMMNSDDIFEGGVYSGTTAYGTTAEGLLTIYADRPFYIDPNCGFVRFGGPMFGIQSSHVESAEISLPDPINIVDGLKFGPITFTYSQWFDITSSEITKNQKLRSISTNNISNILCRVPVTESIKGRRIRYIPETYIGCARTSTDPLYQFDITFLDQFGDQLQIDPNLLFSWNLTLELEL